MDIICFRGYRGYIFSFRQIEHLRPHGEDGYGTAGQLISKPCYKFFIFPPQYLIAEVKRQDKVVGGVPMIASHRTSPHHET